MLVIDMSTIAAAVGRGATGDQVVAQAADSMLDAPVSGGDVGAKAGTLSIMVGGTRRGFRARRSRCSRRWGRPMTHCGPAGRRAAGEGLRTRSWSRIVLDAISETLILAEKAGIATGGAGAGAAGRHRQVRASWSVRGLRKWRRTRISRASRRRIICKDLRIVLATRARHRASRCRSRRRSNRLFDASWSSGGHGNLDNSSVKMTLIGGDVRVSVPHRNRRPSR